MLEAHRLIFADFLDLLERAFEAAENWPAKVIAAIDTAVDFAVAAPTRALVVCAEINPADPQLAAQGRLHRERLTAFLKEGRRQSAEAASLPSVTEQALLAGTAFIFARCLTRGEPEELVSLKPQIAELLLMPYLGRAAAAKAVTA